MTLALSSEEDRRAIKEITASGEPYTAGLGLFVGGEQVTPKSAQWGQSDIPITLDAVVGAVLPRRLDGEHVEFFVQVEDVLVPQLFSAKSAFVVGGSSASSVSQTGWTATELLASTAGSLLSGEDAIRIGGDGAEYFGAPPENIAWDLLSRAPYELSLVRIQALGAPAITWAGSGQNPKLKRQEKLGDGLGRLLKEAGYAARDTATNGCVVAKPVVLGNVSNFARTLDARDFPAWQPPAPVFPRYFDVCVYTENPDGSDAYPPVYEEIPYRGIGRRPYPGQTLYVSLEDASADAEANAAQLAFDLAEAHGRGLYDVPEIVLPFFDPLVEKEDAYLVHEPRRDDDGLWDKLWAWKTGTYKGDFASSSSGARILTTTITASAVVLREDLIDVPALIVPGVSGGVFAPLPDPYGFSDGFWVDPAGQDPVYLNVDATDGLWVDEALSGGRAGFNETDGLWVDI